MVWFKVDDRFHSHPKTTAASLAAIGLWAVAGSWSSDHLTDGFVPDHQLPSLTRGATDLAGELVAAGLWRRVRGGYRFHEWDADSDGTPRNPTRSEATAQRSKKAIGGAIGNHRRWHVQKDRTDPSCPYCQDKHDRKAIGTPIGHRSDNRRGTRIGGDSPDPSRPDPTSTDESVESDAYARAPVDDFALTDAVRRNVARTFPAVDVDHEYAQFVSWYRAKGVAMKNWPEAFMKWCRETARRATERPAAGTPVDRRQQATNDLFDRAMGRANARDTNPKEITG